jgi:hypothetical protein
MSYDDQFDLDRFAHANIPIWPEYGYWISFNVTGPRDALMLMHLRSLVQPFVTLGPPSPVDLFLLSTGEPPARSWTKVGGMPYWEEGRAWPMGNDGRPLPFLAQFNFKSSRDITERLPGDILLIFAYPDLRNGIALEWENIEDTKALITESATTQSSIPKYHGYRWRINCYPDAEPLNDDWWAMLYLPNGEEVMELYTIFRPYGPQIGAFPPLPPQGIKMSSDERIICSLSTISPSAGSPYPFIDRPQPISEQELGNYGIEISDYEPGADVFGNLVVIRASDGRLRGELSYL